MGSQRKLVLNCCVTCPRSSVAVEGFLIVIGGFPHRDNSLGYQLDWIVKYLGDHKACMQMCFVRPCLEAARLRSLWSKNEFIP